MSEPAALERTGRMAWLGRLWPNSLAGRVALVLAGGLLALLVAAVGFDWHDRRNERFQFYVSAVVERIVAVVEELEATPEAERARLAQFAGAIVSQGATSCSANSTRASGSRARWAALPLKFVACRIYGCAHLLAPLARADRQRLAREARDE